MPVAQRRTQLLDAALDLALERGFHAVTVDGVARACGVTRPVVYGLFDSSAALLEGLGERAEQQALAQLAAALPPVPGPDEDADPDALLVAGLAAFLQAVLDEPRTWRVILVPPEGVPAVLADRVTAQREVALDALRALVTWGLPARGGPDLDPELFARSLQVLAEQAARLLLADPAHWSVTSFTLFAQSLLRALRP